MAEYVVISFPGKMIAQEVLQELETSGEFYPTVEAAAVVSCDEEKCSLVRRSQAKVHKDAFGGTMAGGVTGMLIGAGIADSTANPFGNSTGGGLGQMVKGDLSKIGIEEEFSHEVDMALGPNTSAICFIIWDEPWNDLPEVGKEIIKNAHGTVLKTTLSVADEMELGSKLEQANSQNQNDQDSDYQI